MLRSITVKIDLENLARYPDADLAALWGVAQLDPSPTGDWAAGEAVGRLSREIIRRWLKAAGHLMTNHKVEHNYWTELVKVAKYVPPPDTSAGDVERWHQGEWVARDGLAPVLPVVQHIVDCAITFIDAATSMPADVGMRMDALRAAVEALTFPDGKDAPRAGGLPEGVQVNLGARRRVRPEGGQA